LCKRTGIFAKIHLASVLTEGGPARRGPAVSYRRVIENIEYFGFVLRTALLKAVQNDLDPARQDY
jgi:hypothetical protein